MAQALTLKRSAIPGKLPTVSDLALGELGINTADGKLYMKTCQDGVEAFVEIGVGSDGGCLSGWTVSNDGHLIPNGADQNIGSEANPVVEIYVNGNTVYME